MSYTAPPSAVRWHPGQSGYYAVVPWGGTSSAAVTPISSMGAVPTMSLAAGMPQSSTFSGATLQAPRLQPFPFSATLGPQRLSSVQLDGGRPLSSRGPPGNSALYELATSVADTTRAASEACELEASVVVFLSSLNFQCYAESFRRYGFESMVSIIGMERGDMRELGMLPGHIIKLEAAISQLRQNMPAVDALAWRVPSSLAAILPGQAAAFTNAVQAAAGVSPSQSNTTGDAVLVNGPMVPYHPQLHPPLLSVLPKASQQAMSQSQPIGGLLNQRAEATNGLAVGEEGSEARDPKSLPLSPTQVPEVDDSPAKSTQTLAKSNTQSPSGAGEAPPEPPTATQTSVLTDSGATCSIPEVQQVFTLGSRTLEANDVAGVPALPASDVSGLSMGGTPASRPPSSATQSVGSIPFGSTPASRPPSSASQSIGSVSLRRGPSMGRFDNRWPDAELLAAQREAEKLAAGDRALIQWLRQNGFFNVNSEKRKLGGRISYPLHDAAEEGNEAIVKLLLQAGADRKKKNSSGRTGREVAEKKNRRGTHDAILALFDSTAPPAPSSARGGYIQTAPAI
mmetsp:Transcript_66622/g.171470  ORF Transcript_66622/g.171470 Transcript_66622/m.171470 type:complete len:568 (-) Transcript_66622:357-2060(-)